MSRKLLSSETHFGWRPSKIIRVRHWLRVPRVTITETWAYENIHGHQQLVKFEIHGRMWQSIRYLIYRTLSRVVEALKWTRLSFTKNAKS